MAGFRDGRPGTVCAVDQALEAPQHEAKPDPPRLARPTRGALAPVVRAMTRMVSVGLIGVVLMLVGLTWDTASHARDPDPSHGEKTFLTFANPAHALLLVGGVLAFVGLTGALIRALSLSGGRRLSSPRTGTIIVLVSILTVMGSAGAVRWASSLQPPIATGPLAPSTGPDVHNIGIVSSHAPGPCRPTSSQKAAAAKLVSDTEVATAKYRNLAAAVADGFQGPALTSTQHYLNVPNMQDGRVLDPTRPESLIYTASPHGPVLVGVMYVMNYPGEFGPEPGGCLTRWHVHTNVCQDPLQGVLIEVKDTPIVCPPGTIRYIPPPLLHVWFLDVPGGRFAAEVTDEVLAKKVGAPPRPA